MKRHFRTTSVLVVAALCLCLGLSASAFAQGETAATITGRVMDSAGGVIPNATVVITDKATGSERRAQADENGTYTARLLPPGTYTISVAQTNFKKYLQEVGLSAKDRRLVDIVLATGPIDVEQTLLDCPL